LAFLDVCLAVLTSETIGTSTPVRVDGNPSVRGRFVALGAVLTRGRVALDDIGFAVLATESRQARADVGIDRVVAWGAVRAGLRATFVDLNFTGVAAEASEARAVVTGDALRALGS
jgi:hypothetical protein